MKVERENPSIFNFRLSFKSRSALYASLEGINPSPVPIDRDALSPWERAVEQRRVTKGSVCACGGELKGETPDLRLSTFNFLQKQAAQCGSVGFPLSRE
jgi:hypothetical protein